MLRIDVERAAIAAGLDPASRLILGAMALLAMGHDGHVGDAFPSWGTLQAATGYSRRTVARRVAALREAGWLVDTGRRVGATNQIRRYRLTVPPTEAKGCQRDTGKGATLAPRRTEKDQQRTSKVSEYGSDDIPTTGETMPTDDQPTLFATPEASGPSGEAEEAAEPTCDTPDTEAEWRNAMCTWTELAQEAGKRGTPYQRRAPTGKAMHARIVEHGAEAVRQVLRWYWRSQHPRAVFLRGGEYALTTLVRADNFVVYLGMSQADRDACERAPLRPAVPTLERRAAPTLTRRARRPDGAQ